MRYLMLVGLLALYSTMMVSVGCDKTANNAKVEDKNAHDHDHDHDHEHEEDGHAHDHSMGPNGGHVEKFDQTGLRFEWLHDNKAGTVRVIILDGEKNERVSVKADKLVMKSSKGKEPKTYELKPVNADADGKAFEFSLVDLGLIADLGLGVDVSISVDGKDYTRTLEAHVHDH